MTSPTGQLEPARVPAPLVRRLRVLAFDPSLATQLATVAMNAIAVEVRWEDLEPGRWACTSR